MSTYVNQFNDLYCEWGWKIMKVNESKHSYILIIIQTTLIISYNVCITKNYVELRVIKSN